MNTGGGFCSENISSAVYESTMTVDQHSLANVKLKDNFSSGKEFSPKARKPYTITKQREKWKEEEHEKFIEALKLYGRDWRQIEEHVGTKTAVQIRSHAQKFFSKVTRNSSGCSTTSVKCIEIPPPRPKRKPAHPYPRKEVVPQLHKLSSISEQTRSLSPQLSEKESQSPTSTVIGGSESDALVFANSRIHRDSASPDSSNPSIEPNLSSLDNESPTSTPETKTPIPHEEISKNLELFPKEDVNEKEVPIQSLKLFGRTVLVTNPQKQTPTVETCTSKANRKQSENDNQISPWNSKVMESSIGNTEGTWNHGAYYFIQLNSGYSNQGPGSAVPVSWWSSCGSYPLSSAQRLNQADTDLNPEVEDKETRKDQSWCGSNTGSVNCEENTDKCGENDIQSNRLFVNRDEESVCKDWLIGKALSCELISSHEKSTKGFVPYKRCMRERATKPHSFTDAEREEKRIRLCL